MNDITILGTDEQAKENEQKIMRRDGSKVFPITKPLKMELKRLKDAQIGDLKTQIDFLRTQKKLEYAKSQQNRKKSAQKVIGKANKSLSGRVMKIMQEKSTQDAKTKKECIVRDQRYKKQAIGFYDDLRRVQEELPNMTREIVHHDFPLGQFKPLVPVPPVRESWQDDPSYERELEDWREELKEKEREAREVEEKKEKGDYIVMSRYQNLIQREKNEKAFRIEFDEKGFEKMIDKEFEDKYGEPFRVARERIEAGERQFDEALLFGDVQVVKEIYYGLKKADDFLTTLREMKLE